MGIQLINQSSVVTDAEVEAMAAAINVQIHRDFAPAWRINPLTVSIYHHPTWYPFYVVDDIPEAPGALAYHDVDSKTGKPYGRIGAKTCQQAGVTVSSATSHEAVELAGDVYCQQWAFSNRLGCLIAYETADPVEQDSYMIDGVEVSNFVTPFWFVEDGAVHQYDFMHKLTAPYTMTKGGYYIKMSAGKVSQVFGDEGHSDNYTYEEAKKISHGRTFWREAQAYRLLTASGAARGEFVDA